MPRTSGRADRLAGVRAQAVARRSISEGLLCVPPVIDPIESLKIRLAVLGSKKLLCIDQGPAASVRAAKHCGSTNGIAVCMVNRC